MNKLMWLLKWILKAAIFFTLFAFALNNQQDTTLNFFFGSRWHAPQVLIVLIVFSMGVAVGVFGMLPRWWRRQRRSAEPARENARKLPTDAPASESTSIHEL